LAHENKIAKLSEKIVNEEIVLSKHAKIVAEDYLI